MTATSFSPSREAAAEVYEDLKTTIDSTALYFARIHHWDADEALGEARLQFMKAYRSLDRSKGNLKGRVRAKVWYGLLTHKRLAAQRHARLPRLERDLNLEPARSGQPAVFDRDGFLARMTADAKTVVSILLDGAADFDAAVRGDDRPTDFGIKTKLRRYLESLGWSQNRVSEAFEEISFSLN